MNDGEPSMQRLKASLFAALVLYSINAPDSLLAGNRSASPFHQVPATKPSRLVPEVQTDDYSCGYHSLSALYRSHGLDPEKARLRERLGSSVTAVPFVEDSRGTLQPDLFRVLLQDGFYAENVASFQQDDLSKIIDHLDLELYALALFRTEKTLGMHWVVLTGHHQGIVTVADSLEKDIYKVRLAEFAEEKLLNVVLLTPDKPRPGSPYYYAQFKGLVSMANSLWSRLSQPWKVGTVALFLLAGAAVFYAAKRLATQRMFFNRKNRKAKL